MIATKRHRVTPVTKRKRRQSIKRSQVKFRKKTIEVRRPISQRGRTHPMEAPAPGMPLQPQKVLLDSSAIKRFKYYTEEKRLQIWFVEGGIYEYYNVPESVVLTLAEAQSKGRYFYYNIRTSYEYKRILKGGRTMAKKRKVKPLPKMTPKRRAKINKSYAKYNRRYFPASTPKKRKK